MVEIVAAEQFKPDIIVSYLPAFENDLRAVQGAVCDYLAQRAARRDRGDRP